MPEDEGRSISRLTSTIYDRLKQQKVNLVDLASSVHKGTKHDLILGLAEAVSMGKSFNKQDTLGWDGSLNIQDLIDLCKCTHSKKDNGMSVYELLTGRHPAQEHHVSTMNIIKLQDHCKMTNLFRELRQKLPGHFDLERETTKLKQRFHREFEVVFKPTRTTTGYRIDPQNLVECLSFCYYWLKDIKSQWWRIYGDGRSFGGQKTCLIGIANIDNESLVHNIPFQSPEETWPVHIFYGSDSSLCLDINVGEAGYLNEWIGSMYAKGHDIYMVGDMMYIMAILRGKLDPKSEDAFNLYNFEIKLIKADVCPGTGLRSGVNRTIERERPDSLLPAVPTDHYIICANQMFTRISEHLLTLRVMSCLSDAVINNIHTARPPSLQHLISNINSRGVRSGQFDISFTGKELNPISLNVCHAETISAPPSAFETSFGSILEGVASREPFSTKLPATLQKQLGSESDIISEFDLEKTIWETHWELHKLSRVDPDPRKDSS